MARWKITTWDENGRGIHRNGKFSPLTWTAWRHTIFRLCPSGLMKSCCCLRWNLWRCDSVMDDVRRSMDHEKAIKTHFSFTDVVPAKSETILEGIIVLLTHTTGWNSSMLQQLVEAINHSTIWLRFGVFGRAIGASTEPMSLESNLMLSWYKAPVW